LPEISLVMPCLNEEETLGICLGKARDTIQKLGLDAEMVVADNGSTDRSVEIAESYGARVVHQSLKGYGNAYQAGFAAAQGKYLVMGDSDDSYDWTDVGRFIEPLRRGNDMVMGTRIKGTIEPGAMPFLHRYLGTPVLTAVLNLLFRTGVSDVNCGMRSFTREAYDRMHLRASGMEFASEMMIKAGKARLKVAEIPITLHPDKRTRKPHLRTWRDGWRHLRFMLMYSPAGLFLVPGLILLALGLVLLTVLYPGPVHVAGREIDVHSMLLGSLLTILGVQVITTGLFAKVYSYERHFDAQDPLLRGLARHFNLERGLILGLILLFAGFALDLAVAVQWIRSGFGPLNAMRQAIVGSTLLVAGAQILFSSFFLSMLSVQVAELKERPATPLPPS
jgi:glycosyltransferase involved in cell wall biosynthesis